jgi:hypothetical protein
MCDECARLRDQYSKTAESLAAAQRELAVYRAANDRNSLVLLWKECENALKTLSELREEMARHATTHLTSSTSSHAG